MGTGPYRARFLPDKPFPLGKRNIGDSAHAMVRAARTMALFLVLLRVVHTPWMKSILLRFLVSIIVLVMFGGCQEQKDVTQGSTANGTNRIDGHRPGDANQSWPDYQPELIPPVRAVAVVLFRCSENGQPVSEKNVDCNFILNSFLGDLAGRETFDISEVREQVVERMWASGARDPKKGLFRTLLRIRRNASDDCDEPGKDVSKLSNGYLPSTSKSLFQGELFWSVLPYFDNSELGHTPPNDNDSEKVKEIWRALGSTFPDAGNQQRLDAGICERPLDALASFLTEREFSANTVKRFMFMLSANEEVWTLLQETPSEKNRFDVLLEQAPNFLSGLFPLSLNERKRQGVRKVATASARALG